MQIMKRLRVALAVGMAAGALLLSVPGAQAQGPGGGFSMPPEMKAKIAALRKWAEQHKKLTTLSQLVAEIQAEEKDSDLRLDKKQAPKMLALLKTWRNKPTMTDDQAGEVSKQMTAILSTKQLQKLQTFAPRWGGGGGGGKMGGPGGGGGKMGGGKMGGPGGFKIPDPPKGGFNPLNPDTSPFEMMRPMAKKNMDELVANLSKR